MHLLEKVFGKENILVGNVASNRTLARKEFRLYPKGDRISLNLVYPKPEKSELRLYLSKSAGFKPNPGEVWFLFLRKNEVWIGAMKESEWRKENAFYKDDVLAEEAVRSALKDYYDKKGIEYDHSLFPDCEDCAGCGI